MTYLVYYKETGKKLLFKYNLNGRLIAFKTDVEMTTAASDYLKKYFPFRVEDLNFYRTHKAFRVEKLEADLTFDNFWNTYANKVGNKARAQKLWNALSEVQRAKALSYIKTYNNILLQQPGVQKLYPETYLNQKRFDNE